MHLWEASHPYYCNQGNYYTNTDVGDYHDNIDDFIEEHGDSDFDMNLLFRFDWQENEDEPYTGDDQAKIGTLLCFWMGQRKGSYWYSEVKVCRADEEKVKTFLLPRLAHLKTLWAPLE